MGKSERPGVTPHGDTPVSGEEVIHTWKDIIYSLRNGLIQKVNRSKKWPYLVSIGLRNGQGSSKKWPYFQNSRRKNPPSSFGYAPKLGNVNAGSSSQEERWNTGGTKK
jgi:hypothetical protein